MANTLSSAKRARQTETRTDRNRAVRSRVRSQAKQIQSLIKEGKSEEAKAAFPRFTAVLDKAAKRGIVHSNYADRKKSAVNRALAGK